MCSPQHESSRGPFSGTQKASDSLRTTTTWLTGVAPESDHGATGAGRRKRCFELATGSQCLRRCLRAHRAMPVAASFLNPLAQVSRLGRSGTPRFSKHAECHGSSRVVTAHRRLHGSVTRARSVPRRFPRSACIAQLLERRRRAGSSGELRLRRCEVTGPRIGARAGAMWLVGAGDRGKSSGAGRDGYLGSSAQATRTASTSCAVSTEGGPPVDASASLSTFSVTAAVCCHVIIANMMEASGSSNIRPTV